MTPQELEGIGTAVSRAIGEACAALRAEHAQAIEAVRRDDEQARRALEQRCDRAETRADRAEAELAQVRRDLEATRELAAEPAVVAALMDAAGVLHLVQRNGERLTVPLADMEAIIAAAVSERAEGAEQRLGARLDSRIARALQMIGGAPRWSATEPYAPDAVVACYMGRTYALRAGVKASIGQEPGEHPDVWERIGSHGLRVFKSRPEHLEAGDMFTEGDSRFIFDGQAVTLLVPRALKQSDLERAVKPVQAEARAAAELASRVQRQADQVQHDVDEVRPVAERAERAANDAQTWIRNEGDAAVIRSAETQAWCANRALLIDSPALARLIDAADEDDPPPDPGAPQP